MKRFIHSIRGGSYLGAELTVNSAILKVGGALSQPSGHAVVGLKLFQVMQCSNVSVRFSVTDIF